MKKSTQGGTAVKVAVATEGDRVSEHFGHSPVFILAEVENGEILSRNSVESPEHAPGRIPAFLKEQGAEAVITCSMGQRAQTIFQHFGIECVLGITGSVDEVLQQYAAGTLVSGESNCSRGGEHQHHHGHHH
jgi:predicted Fe-Mo cluster-binding NifX family protein